MTVELDLDGIAAPPRSNGELVFAEPWQSRAFGMAMSLTEAGAFTWDEFRERLIHQISSWESNAVPGECYSYYDCWVAALEQVVVDKELVGPGALSERGVELVSRPAGYDHGHDHDHDHGHDHGHDHDH